MPGGKREKQIHIRDCKNCKRRFESTRSKKEFCDKACKNLWFNQSKVLSYLKLPADKVESLKKEAKEKYGASGPKEINLLFKSKL